MSYKETQSTSNRPKLWKQSTACNSKNTKINGDFVKLTIHISKGLLHYTGKISTKANCSLATQNAKNNTN